MASWVGMNPASTAMPELTQAMSTSSRLLAVCDADSSMISKFLGFAVISLIVIASPSLPDTSIRPADWSRKRLLAPLVESSGIAILAPSSKSFRSVILDE